MFGEWKKTDRHTVTLNYEIGTVWETKPRTSGLLTLNLLTTTIVAPPSNASKWQMGFNSTFKRLMGQGQVT